MRSHRTWAGWAVITAGAVPAFLMLGFAGVIAWVAGSRAFLDMSSDVDEGPFDLDDALRTVSRGDDPPPGAAPAGAYSSTDAPAGDAGRTVGPLPPLQMAAVVL